MEHFRVVRWTDEYHRAFIDLSVEWLEKYVSVEPADLLLLHHPHEQILEPGGAIFFVLAGETPVGTVAMIRVSDTAFELAKLAVTEDYQGRGLADLLMQSALGFARERGAEEVILYTNHKLRPAIGLYRKYGFADVPLRQNKYLESDRKMRLELKRGGDRQ